MAGALTAFHAYLGTRIGIDLAEEESSTSRGKKRFSRPEKLPPWFFSTCSGSGSDEIPGHAHVEEELPRPRGARRAGEGLARTDEIHGRGRDCLGRRLGRQLRRYRWGGGRVWSPSAGPGTTRRWRRSAIGLHGLLRYCSCMASNCIAIYSSVPANRLLFLRVTGVTGAKQARHEGDGNE